jgi:hypothetical protein
MSGRQTDLSPAMLTGTPVGGPSRFAVCDTCNRRLTDGHRDTTPTTPRPMPCTLTRPAFEARIGGRFGG